MSTRMTATTDAEQKDPLDAEPRLWCPECRCSFPEWVKRCPVCAMKLSPVRAPEPPPPASVLPYIDLVSLVSEHGGTVTIPMTTVEVAKAEQLRFPYLGYGFTWAKRLEGELTGAPVVLRTEAVGIHKTWTFPYMGYGFGWNRRMAGHVAGNSLRLKADRVEMKKEWGFPYFGFGTAWASDMSGRCGDDLRLRFVARDVVTDKKRRFPYFGFGFAWIATGTLTIACDSDTGRRSGPDQPRPSNSL